MATEVLVLEELAARVADLEKRLAVVESPDGLDRASAASRAGQGDGTDPETFWALAGLKARIGDRSAVLFTGSVTLPNAPAYVWQQGVDIESLLETDWDLAADPLGALGHPVRLTVLREVLRGQHTTAEIGSVDGLGTTGQLYHHLRQLLAAGWLRSSGRGRYEVPAARVIPLLVIMAAAGP
jgi:Helix-turn-helix domain